MWRWHLCRTAPSAAPHVAPAHRSPIVLSCSQFNARSIFPDSIWFCRSFPSCAPPHPNAQPASPCSFCVFTLSCVMLHSFLDRTFHFFFFFFFFFRLFCMAFRVSGRICWIFMSWTCMKMLYNSICMHTTEKKTNANRTDGCKNRPRRYGKRPQLNKWVIIKMDVYMIGVMPWNTNENMKSALNLPSSLPPSTFLICSRLLR